MYRFTPTPTQLSSVGIQPGLRRGGFTCLAQWQKGFRGGQAHTPVAGVTHNNQQACKAEWVYLPIFHRDIQHAYFHLLMYHGGWLSPCRPRLPTSAHLIGV